MTQYLLTGQSNAQGKGHIKHKVILQLTHHIQGEKKINNEMVTYLLKM